MSAKLSAQWLSSWVTTFTQPVLLPWSLLGYRHEQQPVACIVIVVPPHLTHPISHLVLGIWLPKHLPLLLRPPFCPWPHPLSAQKGVMYTLPGTLHCPTRIILPARNLSVCLTDTQDKLSGGSLALRAHCRPSFIILLESHHMNQSILTQLHVLFACNILSHLSLALLTPTE